MFIDQHLTGYSDEEVRRWLWLRAIEWNNWPIFISQPILPIAIIFFHWWAILAVVLTLDILWALIRYKYVNPYLADYAVLFVKLKWLSAIGSCIYLITRGDYVLAFLAVLLPLVVSIISIPGKIGKAELLLANKIGYISQDSND
ncbi:MAG: hypothetical protein ACYDA4_15210 [Ignavibacteriaceae bacterium]